MNEKQKDKLLNNLPACAVEFIKLVIKKMRYRKKVRLDVQAELAAHFEDELRDCKTDEEKEKRAEQLIADFGDVKLLAVLMRRAKKRCRPLWRTMFARACQAVVILFIAFIIYLAWFLTGKPAITTNYVAELNRLVKPVADENLNAAPLYERAAVLVRELPDETRILLKTKPYEADTEQKLLIERWISENEHVLQLIVDASKKPYYWRKYISPEEEYGMMGILLPHLADFRTLAFALCWRAQFNVEQHRFEDAVDDLIACYKFGRHLKGDNTLIEQLVGIAIERFSAQKTREIMSEHTIDSSVLAMLQQEYEKVTTNEYFAVSFKGDRLFIYDEIQRCFTEDFIGGGHISLDAFKRLESIGEISSGDFDLGGEFLSKSLHILFNHPNKKQTRQMADRLYNFLEEMTHKSPAQVHAEAINIQKEVEEIAKGNIFLELFIPAVDRIVLIGHRSKVDIQATLAVIAITRYKQDIGNYPDSLQELVNTGYIKELPMDPYSGGPLLYRRTDEGFVLYSVGENFTDDGGKIVRDEQGRVKRWPDDGDMVFWPVPKTEKE